MSVHQFPVRPDPHDAAYARAELDRMIEDVGGLLGLRDRLGSLVKELRADGFEAAAFFAQQAMPLLARVEGVLEQAKERV